MTDKQKDGCRDRLKRIIFKKMDTVMIYPLSEFEAFFGELWGIHKNPDNLTEQEKMYRMKWQTCRKNILDNGNRQKIAINKELEMHEIIWNRYQAEFIPVKRI